MTEVFAQEIYTGPIYLLCFITPGIFTEYTSDYPELFTSGKIPNFLIFSTLLTYLVKFK